MSTAPTPESPAFPDHPNWAGPRRFALSCAVAGFAVWGLVGALNYGMAHGPEESGAAKGQFFLSYLVGFIYWLSLPIGGMGLLFIHYLAKTSWGILLKRPFEAATRTLPLLALLFIPVIVSLSLGKDSPYWWAAPEHMEVPDADKVAAERPGQDQEIGTGNRETAYRNFGKMKLKAIVKEQEERREGTFGFLTPTALIVVPIGLFAIWGTFIYFLNKWGQDAQNDTSKVLPSLEKLKNISGPGLIVFAISVTVASSQWVMSLEPSWASTMFPVIFAMNQFLTCFGFCLALFLTLADRPPLKDILRDKFQLDMGTLLLVFTLFWSYTSFSQMMLVWIGNLPEEIPFYLKRSQPPYQFWWCVSAGLIALHFALPFLLLLFRDIKMHPKRLRAVALYLLVICAIDVTWWIEPAKTHANLIYLLMDAGAIVGIGGLWGTWFLAALRRRPLLPTNELYWLPEGHHHEQH